MSNTKEGAAQSIIQHEMLVANAGSGKTYRLTIRTITLLALGVAPDKIAALTFTRKAAGEFLKAIFMRLAQAAEDAQELEKLRKETGVFNLDAARCCRLLRDLSAHLHRLSMGTIDSLFAKIARAFPFECGLSGDFSILGPTGQQEARRTVLADVFRENAKDDKQFDAFLELIRQQSRNQSDRDIFEVLLEEIQKLHESFLRTTAGTVWGDAAVIWPQGSPILKAGYHRDAADALWMAITATHPDLDEDAVEKWTHNLDLVRAFPQGVSLDESLKVFLKERLSKCSMDKKTGEEYMPTGGKKAARVVLNSAVRNARQDLVYSLLKPEIEERLRRSTALYRMMDNFEEIYSRTVRGLGLLTFGDIISLLANQVEHPDWRAIVGYRLDTRFDHWLLDEFQDTSRQQWKVLGSLADEIIQDAGGERSFFYVGDTKQAIYSWRGGDPALFFEIHERYNHGAEEQIKRAAPLAVSYRSDKAVIEVINQIFGNIEATKDDLELPEAVVDAWKQAWVTHEIRSDSTSEGYVRWVGVDDASMDSAEDNDENSPVDIEILRILKEVKPWEREWTCATLKRTNAQMNALATLLQQNGIPLAVEGKSNPCCDNPLGLALLAAFRFCASPDDVASKVLLAAGPLGSYLLQNDQFSFREQTLELVVREGFAGTIQKWLGKLDFSSESFLREKAANFLAAAEEFDAGRRPSDGFGEFIRHIESYQREESESAGVVRVMTVHQAKGLTLDMTIVSGMDQDPIAKDKTAGVLALGQNTEQKTWGILMPDKMISQHDDILNTLRMKMIGESAYGELCTAYVAMSRPRHALYLVTKKLSANTRAKNFARLLDITLNYTEPCWQSGDGAWYESNPIKITEEVDSKVDSGEISLPVPITLIPHPISPSHLDEGKDRDQSARILATGKAGSSKLKKSPGVVFSPNAAALGTEVHMALASIEWNDAPLPDSVNISSEARKMVKAFLELETTHSIFTRPKGPHLLWRERAFDLMLDGQWVSGIFDRVHILLGPGAVPLSAQIYDFKTDVASQADVSLRHASQLALYKKAASLLLGIKEADVEAEAVLVRSENHI